MIRCLKDSGESYPIPSNIDGAVYALISDDCVLPNLADEFLINYSSSSLGISFSKGCVAIIGGNALWLTDTESLILPSNSIVNVCLRIDCSLPNGQRGLLKYLSDSEIKSGNVNDYGTRDLVLYQVTTNDSGVTNVTDKRVIGKTVDKKIEDIIGLAINGEY